MEEIEKINLRGGDGGKGGEKIPTKFYLTNIFFIRDLKCLIRESSTQGNSPSTTRKGNPRTCAAPSLAQSLPSPCSLLPAPCGIKVSIIINPDKFESRFFNFGSAGNGKDCGTGFVYASDPNDLSVPLSNNCRQVHVFPHVLPTSSPPRACAFPTTKSFATTTYRTPNFLLHTITKTSSKPSFGAPSSPSGSVSSG